MNIIVGNNSSWSIRALLCLKIAGIKPNIVPIDLQSDSKDALLSRLSPSSLVPVLIDNDIVVHDSLAIVEYVNEITAGALYPAACTERAQARSLCCELHAGFTNIRRTLPFHLSEKKNTPHLTLEIERELNRVKTIFSRANQSFMWNKPTVVDAFYSVMAFRLASYGIYFEGISGNYQQHLLQWDLLQQTLEESKHWR